VFDTLSDKLQGALGDLRKKGTLDEASISRAMREIRLALLEADVNFTVVRDFVGRVREKALGDDILKSLTPGQQVVKVVHDELTQLMGEGESGLAFGTFTVILLAGLQGSGKTTTAAKLALHLRKEGRKPGLIAADLQRPAAIDQLEQLGNQIQVPVFRTDTKDAVEATRSGLARARAEGLDTVIVDTAGRLQIDEELMDELVRVRDAAKPTNVLLVLDAMTGQEAVNVAEAFHERIAFDGVVLSKLDGDARGGAALSVKAITGKPIKFVGMGEASDRLEEFRPDGMASRILGRGDVVGLVQQFEEVVDEEKAEQDAVRMLKGKFDMNDFLEQIGVLQKMGSLSDMADKIPGMADAMPEGAKIDDRELDRIKAVISSMTEDERRHPERFVITSWEEIVEGGKRKKKRSAFYDQSRLQRVARGSGRKEAEVGDILNRFATMRQMMMQIGMSTGLLGKIPGFKQLAQLKKLGNLDVNQLASMMNTPSAERGHFQAPKRNVDRMKEKRKRKDARKARKKARKRR